MSWGRCPGHWNFLDQGPVAGRHRAGYHERGLLPDRQQPLEFFVNGLRTVQPPGMDTQHESCVVRCLCHTHTGMVLLPQWLDAENHIG